MQSDAVPGLKRRKLNLIDFESVISEDKSMACTTDASSSDDDNTSNEFIDDKQVNSKKKTRGRVKIKMEFIENKLRRYTTFSKRKAGIMKKAYELATLTGTEVMLLVASETGHVYTFATKKLQPMITSAAGKALIQTCLSSPTNAGVTSDNARSCYEQPLSPPSSNEFEEIEFNVNQDSSETKSSPVNNFFDFPRQNDITPVSCSSSAIRNDDSAGANALLTVPISCLFLQKLASNPLMLADESKKFNEHSISFAASEPGRVFDDTSSVNKDRFIQPFITIPLSIATFANASCIPGFQPSASIANIIPSSPMTSFQQQ